MKNISMCTKGFRINTFSFCFIFILFIFVYNDLHSKVQLSEMYERSWRESSDIRDHVPVLRQLAMECSSAVEIGLRDMVSTWGILQGLSESRVRFPSYTGIDLALPPQNILNLAKNLAQENGISFKFIQKNDMTIKMDPVDLLFIDSLHTYCHLTYELETFSPSVKKYIAMHDTSEPWGEIDDNQYHGNYSEYPAHFDRTKRGLWLAVEDFLKRHPEWFLYERRFSCHGFTVLKRVEK